MAATAHDTDNYDPAANWDLPPMPTAAQLPRATRVEMLYFADEDCWRLAMFAGKQMLGAHFTAPAGDLPRLELMLQAVARILHQQAAARDDFSGVLDGGILDGGDIIR
jgi:hypothetical protein